MHVQRPGLRRFLTRTDGFTGAEKALLICFGLAIVVLVGVLVRGGSGKAGADAQRTLAQGTSALSGGARVGALMPTRALPAAPPAPRTPGAIATAAPIAAAPAAITAPAPAPVAAPAPAAPVGPTPLRPGQTDTAYDGAWVGAGGRAYPRSTPMRDIPPVQPSDGRQTFVTGVYVNGIQTDLATQSRTLQGFADRTGFAMVGIHNSTESFTRDLAQCLSDKADWSRNPAVDSLANLIYDSVKAGRPIHVFAHSQGGLITSRALSHVYRRLRLEDHLSRRETERRLGMVQVETFGAAAGSYPDGPQYVHYVNRGDPVPVGTGLGASKWFSDSRPGRGAKVIRFNEFHLNPIGAHNIDDVYIPRRRPFPEVYR